jgi:hypothetical protein
VTKRIYVETTVISYLSARPTRDLIRAAQQELTQEWWERKRKNYELYTSQFVFDEASAGDSDAAKRRLQVLRGIVLLDILPEAPDIVGVIRSFGLAAPVICTPFEIMGEDDAEETH